MEKISIGRICSDLQELCGPPDLTATGILGMPGSVRRFIRWIIQNSAVACEQAADFLGEPERRVQPLLDELAARGFIEHVPTCGVPVYRVCLVPRRLRPPTDLLELLEE